MAKKRADGRLQKKFRINGKQYIVYGKTSKELFEKEKLKRDEIEKGFEKRKNPTFSEYYEMWADARKGTVKISTLRIQDKITNVLKSVYIPTASRTFGELKLKDITKNDLVEIQKALSKDRMTQTTNDYMALLKHIIGDAFKERLIEYNPCLTLQNLKRTEEKARDTHHRALSPEEIKSFFSCAECKRNYYYNVFKFAYKTGMRAGEIGALKNSDIRKDGIHIERTITRTETGGYILGADAKTQAGKRVIPLNDTIKGILADQREINRLLDCDTVFSLDDCIFKAPKRGLMVVTPIDREIKKICISCGLEPFTMHAFRDTFITELYSAGVSIKTIQELTGQKDLKTTWKIYIHDTSEQKQRAMELVNVAI